MSERSLAIASTTLHKAFTPRRFGLATFRAKVVLHPCPTLGEICCVSTCHKQHTSRLHARTPKVEMICSAPFAAYRFASPCLRRMTASTSASEALPSQVPAMPVQTMEQVEASVPRQDLIRLSRVLTRCQRPLVLTGAGISTASGIPDYRSPGRGEYKPLQHKQFIESKATRHRYWARSMAGYRRVSRARPGEAHRILAALQREWEESKTDGVLITQNVDGLHARAGSESVLELHGTIHRVGCLQCGVDVCRAELQAEFERQNSDWMLSNGLASEAMMIEAEERGRTFQRPDGDSEIPESAYASFRVPRPCLRPSREWSAVERSPSGAIISAAMRARRKFDARNPQLVQLQRGSAALSGVAHHADAVGRRPVSNAGRGGCADQLMPRLVFHGGTLPPGVTAQSLKQAASCDALVVLGSTLSTFSALRLVRAAKEAGATVVIVNHGETRGDGLADTLIDGDIASVLRAALVADWGAEWLQSRLRELPDSLPSPADAIHSNARR